MRTADFSVVVTGLVPVTPLRLARHLPSKRDGRDIARDAVSTGMPGDDSGTAWLRPQSLLRSPS